MYIWIIPSTIWSFSSIFIYVLHTLHMKTEETVSKQFQARKKNLLPKYHLNKFVIFAWFVIVLAPFTVWKRVMRCTWNRRNRNETYSSMLKKLPSRTSIEQVCKFCLVRANFSTCSFLYDDHCINLGLVLSSSSRLSSQTKSTIIWSLLFWLISSAASTYNHLVKKNFCYSWLINNSRMREISVLVIELSKGVAYESECEGVWSRCTWFLDSFHFFNSLSLFLWLLPAM